MSAPARAAGRLALAGAGALVLWLAFGAQVWGGAVAAVAETSIRAFERPRVTRLETSANEVLVKRSDMGGDSDIPAFDLTAFTAPTVLLLTLLWGAGRLVPRRGAWRGFAACGALLLAQALHLVAAVETLYATQLGEWSVANYTRFQRELAATGRSLFDLGLAWGLPFALWVLFYGLPAFRAVESAPKAKRRRK